MKLRRGDWPIVITKLVDGIVELAKIAGVHGRVAVHESREGDASFYVITVRVPAAETASSRAMPPPKTK